MLDEKLKMLADEYLIDFNGTRAYKAVWGEHVTDNTAAVEASKHLRKPKVAQYLQDRIKEREKRTEITQDDVVMKYKLQGYNNIKLEIEHLKSQIKIIDNYSGVTGINYGGTGGSSGISDMTFNAASLRIAKKDKLYAKIEILNKDLKECDLFINGLEPREREIIKGYYVNKCSWEQVGSKIGLSGRQCQRIRDRIFSQ